MNRSGKYFSKFEIVFLREASDRKRIERSKTRSLGTQMGFKRRVLEMPKSCQPNWRLKSCWAIRSAAKYRGNASASAYLLEHEVTVSGGPLQVELVAKFVHSISEFRTRRSNHLMRGGLVSLTIRKGRYNKRIDGREISKLIFHLKRHSM